MPNATRIYSITCYRESIIVIIFTNMFASFIVAKMTGLIHYMLNKNVIFFLVISSIQFILVHSISNSSWKSYETKISDLTRIQVQCNDTNGEFTEEQIFQCDDGTCIPKKYKCDRIEHCGDGSDEWSKICEETTGKSRKKRATDGHCVEPSASPDKTISYECEGTGNTNSTDCMVNGRIRENTLARIACKPNYLPRDGTQYESVCNRRKWIPNLDSCHKRCTKLNAVNVDLECYRNNEQIACNENTLIAGVRVHPTCKLLHTPKGPAPDYAQIVCQNDGEWNNPLFSCKPECGIPYTGAKLLIANGHKEQFGQSPWNVAVYDEKKVLICGGTIIHPRLILSAAHCFYDLQTQQKLDTENFEIVVSKFSRNYSIADNKYQKAFKIREILVSNKGFYGVQDYYTSDIVLLILQEKLTISPTVLPACIDPIHMKRYPSEGTMGKVVGWGNNEKGDLPEYLHTADLPFVGRKRCIETVPVDFKSYITFDKFCAGSENDTKRAGVLPGDSGGGLLFKQDDAYFIRGIVSIKQANPESRIAAFTDLAPYVEWIVSVRDDIEREMIESNPLPRTPPQNITPVTKSTDIAPIPESGGTTKHSHCAIPDLNKSSYETSKYECTNGKTNQYCIGNGNTMAPEHTKATLTCKLGYLIEKDHPFSVCREGSWVPKLPRCKRVCDQLFLRNVDLTCYRSNNASTDCNGPLIVGDRVRPKCKPFHTYKDFVPFHQELVCQEDGKWDNILFSCVPECGRSYTNVVALIAHGTKEKYGDSPWHVAIYNQKKILVCAGTIITPYMVLSTALCFHDHVSEIKLDAHLYEVVVSKATRNYQVKDNESQKVHKIKEIRSSPKGYNGLIDYYANDIVILILMERISISSTVLPACVDWMHTKKYIPDGTLGKVSGWGLNEFGNYNESLFGTQLPYISREKCIDTVPTDFTPFITYDKFCAGSETGSSVLQGDSGGGLLFREGGFYYIRGLVSVKMSTQTALAAFTDLSEHVEWILSVREEIEKNTNKLDMISIRG